MPNRKLSFPTKFDVGRADFPLFEDKTTLFNFLQFSRVPENDENGVQFSLVFFAGNIYHAAMT